jgi:hypothetical protein
VSTLAELGSEEVAVPRSAPSAGELWVRPDLAPLFAELAFDDFVRLGAHPVRTGPDDARETSWFERAGRRDARPEARALARLAELGIGAPKLAAFGARGRNPARRRSFVVTEALEETEDLAVALARAPAPARIST